MAQHVSTTDPTPTPAAGDARPSHRPPEAPVLLGLGDDEDVSSQLALDWAAADALSRNRRLHVIRAYRWALGAVPWETAADRVIIDDLRRAADARLARALAHVAAKWPGLECSGEVVDAIPDELLLGRSGAADVTVLGSRQLSLVGGAVLGSVSTAVAARAESTVVVVPGSAADPSEEASVVVGVDGSDESQDALAFGFDHAARRGRDVRAVFCWRPDTLAAMQWRPEQPPPERADRWLAEAVAGWQEKYPDVVVHRAVVRAHPVDGLLAESTAQELLVVGGHTRHAQLGRLLGSVSQGVLHHARCPVAIVHHARPA